MIEDKENLQNQKKQLENQQSQNEDERNFKEKLIAQINEKLKEKDAEISLLKNKKSNQPTDPSQNNSNLVKWAIGLSIVAIVIGVLAVILWLGTKKRNN